MAILANAVDRGTTVELNGIGLLRPRDNGALHYPILLNDDERAHVRAMTAILTKTASGLTGSWESIGGTGGAIELAELPQQPHDNEMCADWDAFKAWATRVRREIDSSLYRGHGRSQYRLQTTLHRAGRHRLERYCAGTLAQFHSKAEGVLGMRLDMQDGADFSTVLGLAQHHGLPTPMLDWTESPYVAAFFADALENEGARPEGENVRIYALARHYVDNTSPPMVVLPVAHPYASSLGISSRYNPRLQAQQGQFMVTNVADLETWVANVERRVGKPTLRSVEVPARFAREALEDLAFMGLTASTLFPGLDGVCRSLRHSMSFVRNPLPMAGLPADGGAVEEARHPSAEKVVKFSESSELDAQLPSPPFDLLALAAAS